MFPAAPSCMPPASPYSNKWDSEPKHSGEPPYSPTSLTDILLNKVFTFRPRWGIIKLVWAWMCLPCAGVQVEPNSTPDGHLMKWCTSTQRLLLYMGQVTVWWWVPELTRKTTWQLPTNGSNKVKQAGERLTDHKQSPGLCISWAVILGF